MSLDDESSFLVTLVLKRKANLAEWILLSLLRSLELPFGAGMVSLKKAVFSAERLALGRYIPIQKGTEFVMDNNWGTFKWTIAARRLDGFPSSFNQLSAEYASLFLL